VFHALTGTLTANGARVLKSRVEVPGGILVVVDDYLFADAANLTASKAHGLSDTRPEALVKGDAAANDAPVVITKPAEPGHDANSTFIENLSQVLGFLKSGVRVFQHFLSRSNVSQLLKNG
jgi:transforming growth factor-beta-induced protein